MLVYLHLPRPESAIFEYYDTAFILWIDNLLDPVPPWLHSQWPMGGHNVTINKYILPTFSNTYLSN